MERSKRLELAERDLLILQYRRHIEHIEKIRRLRRLSKFYRACRKIKGVMKKETV